MLNRLSVITEIVEVNESGSYIIIKDMEIPSEPPDDTHIIQDYSYCSCFVPLTEGCSSNGTANSILMGSTATGSNSFSANFGNATGYNSLATNYGNATGSSAAALNYGKAYGTYAFSANNGQSDAENTTAFNYALNYNPYSLASGYYSRIFGRPIKLTAINHSAKTLTMASGQNTSGIVGKKIIIRCYNINNSIIFREATVSSVSGTTIYLNSDAYFNTSTNYKETLFPDGLAFIIDKSSSYGTSNFVGGYYCIACGKYSFAHGQYTIAGHDNAVIFGKYGVTDSASGLYLANGTSTKAPGLAFKALSDGSVHADGEYTSPCADYAEFFEWADGNPNNEDRAGYFVKLSGDKIVKCDEFDIPLGVISAKPAIIGDSGEMHWQGKFVTDNFGRVQYHDVVVPAEVDAEGNIIVEEHTENQPILNPDWNAKQEYIPRKNRPEWATVGVPGKLIVYDDGTLKSGDLCRCGKNGTAAKSIKDGYPVLKRVSEDKVLIWVK